MSRFRLIRATPAVDSPVCDLRPSRCEGHRAFRSIRCGASIIAVFAIVSSFASHAVASWKACVASGFNDAIIRYDGATGVPIDHLVAFGMSSLTFPGGMTLGPDGMLYVCSELSNQVLRYDSQSGQPIDVFIQAGTGINLPQEIIFKGAHAYVSSGGSGSVMRFDAQFGTFVDNFVPPGSGGLDGPVGMCFGPDGHLYVASYWSHQVLRYHGTTGAFLGVFVGASSGGLTNPWGLVFLPGGPLLVSSAGSDSVLRFNATTGAFAGSLVAAGGPIPIAPAFIRLGPDGALYVPNRFGPSSSVVKFNPESGTYLGTFVIPGAGGLSNAHDIIFIEDPADCTGDLDGNGVVNGADLGLLLGSWGFCTE